MTQTSQDGPLISVVVPTWRDQVHVIEAIASIRAQTRTDWEAIVIDDGSDRGVQAALTAHVAGLNDPRIRLVLSARNRGPARNRNLGIRLARGRYLAFLDGDDLWLPEKLTVQLAALQDSAALLCCTAYENFDAQSGATTVRVPPARITHAGLLPGNTIGCSTVLIDRTRVPRPRFPDIPMRQDFALWLKILRDGGFALGLDRALTRRRIHGASLSANKWRAARYTWRMYRDVEGLGPLAAARVFARYALAGVGRAAFRKKS